MAVITAPKKTSAAPDGARSTRRGPHALLLNLAALVLGIAVWALVASAQLADVPGPLSVASRAGELLGDGTLGQDALASLRRVFLGWALGTLVAVPVGFLMGWYTLARGLIEPYIQFFRTIPPLAMIPLAIVLMGIGETPKIFVIFLASFMSCVVAAFQGVTGVDSTLINAARVLGASDRVIFLKVVVPAATPFILVGMRIGLGSSWATVVAAEIIGADKGLGYEMMHAQTYYDIPTIFVGLICIGVIGLVMDRLLLLAERRLTGWQERR
ncbi:ABC transporter permease [Streptomyces odontomachi]|uniref:ABC transporter permease n=1 Tax=Streptomyces odontomachi TaxID=2944940 RepID=UPI00210EE303|nr:ABC transporter permease [Streptomyces sp. ODS25]